MSEVKQILNKEQRVMRMMRKVLAEVVKDTTPKPGAPHPLRPETLGLLKDCFALISSREQELAVEQGMATDERPRYKDDAPSSAHVVPLDQIRRIKKKEEESSD